MTSVVMPDERCPLPGCGWERCDRTDDTPTTIAAAIRAHLDECHLGWTVVSLQVAVMVGQVTAVLRAGPADLFGPMAAPPWGPDLC